MATWSRRRRVAAVLFAGTLLVAMPLAWRPVAAQYTATTAVPATVAASAGFPGLPQLVTDGGPLFYHRGEESQTGALSSTAVDSSGNGQDGAYANSTNGPSLWWPMDDGPAATRYRDLSGTTDTGKPTGTPMTVTNTTGPTGGAYMLGASTASCCAQATLSSVLSPFRADRDFTVALWVDIGDTAPAAGSRFSAFHMTNSSYRRSDVALLVDNSASCAMAPCWAFTMAKDPNSTTVTGWDTAYGSAAAVNTWTHLTAVFVAATGTMSLYVNGVAPPATATHTVPADAATDRNVGFGRYRTGAGTGNWAGYGGRNTGIGMIIGEARTWRRALSAAEVAELPVRATSRWTFDEATGTTPGYTTASASTGTPSVTGSSTAGVTAGAAAALTTGRTGNALTIATAGVNGYVQGPSAQVTTSGSFSVAAWVRLTDTSADRTIVSQNGVLGTAFTLGYDSTANRWRMRWWPSDAAVVTPKSTVSAAAPVLNQWTHVAGVYEAGKEIRLYVDGRSSGTATPATTAAWPSLGATQIGRRVVGGATAEGWQGQIDDLRVYNGYPVVSTTMRQLVGSVEVEETGGLAGTRPLHANTTAMAFGGSSSGGNGRFAAAVAGPAFTEECLIRVASGETGVIGGFADTDDQLDSTVTDRLMYVDTTGRVRFGVLGAGVPVTVVSAAAVDDGTWHHVLASVGAAGLKLYVDGVKVTGTAVTAAASTTGYWRWGGVAMLPLNGWPSAPSNPYLTGTIDEFAVYDRQLTDQEDLWRVYADYLE
ncbi:MULTISPECIES: LamG-like jellyroll fold domain-containing protein [unclassified Actinoplanes]|uniref:LamG domain-containing protein n=1 Tax=unclassified Actinoplanes TaxID=2626549 RepID=UPI0005B94735|nr:MULTISPECIES: LamG-like jellyroll fold domain-containing protein [unclassified Actinoplanes]